MADDADQASELEELERAALIARHRKLFGGQPAPTAPPALPKDDAP